MIFTGSSIGRIEAGFNLCKKRIVSGSKNDEFFKELIVFFDNIEDSIGKWFHIGVEHFEQ